MVQYRRVFVKNGKSTTNYTEIGTNRKGQVIVVGIDHFEKYNKNERKIIMYGKFKIQKNVISQLQVPKDIMNEMSGAYEKGCVEVLEQLIVPKEGSDVIDGDVLKAWNFPTEHGRYPIFISHSFKDKDEAIKLAAYIKKKYEIDCFIDSMVWNSAYTLLEKLDQKYCGEKDPITNKWKYWYEKRNYSTQHVYAMLSMALLEMIDFAVCGIFIESENSVVDFNNIADGSLSSWIYEEINYMNLVRPNIPAYCMGEGFLLESQETFSEDVPFKMSHAFDLSHFKAMTLRELSLNLSGYQWIREICKDLPK